MMSIAIAVAAVMALAVAATIFFIIRPLSTVTKVTERLASGDMRPVTGFEKSSGEIGRMGKALTVFRDGMIERERMQDEEKQREREAEEAARQQELERIENEQKEAEIAAEAKRVQMEKEARDLEEKEALRAAADAERQAKAAETMRVVETFADAMKKLAAGNFSVRVLEVFPPEFEELRADFNMATESLAALIGQIARSATRIDDSSAEIAAATNDLSQRTEKSVVSLEHTSSAIHELTASVSSAAENADSANSVSRSTNERANASQKVVTEAITAMSEIDTSSREISKIIGVIDDISFQTNLLALNAGVEAARAGEAGRGFAVVASEVRALAQRSSDAAREINQLITESNGQIQRGVRLVDEAGDALKDIISSVSEIATNVEGIATSTREQSTGIREINDATNQIEGTMQQNAAMTEETTAASQVLSVEARKLLEVIQQFEIGHDTAAPSFAKDEDAA